jgi:hypothetical protein
VTEDEFRCYPSRSASLVFYSRQVPGVVRGLFLFCLAATLLIAAAYVGLHAVDAPAALEQPLRVLLAIVALPAVAGWVYFFDIRGPLLLIAYRRGGMPEDDARWIMKRARPQAEFVVPGAPPGRAGWRSRWIAKALLGHLGGRRGFAHRFLSEIYDSDKPNFYKHFLRVRADPDRMRHLLRGDRDGGARRPAARGRRGGDPAPGRPTELASAGTVTAPRRRLPGGSSAVDRAVHANASTTATASRRRGLARRAPRACS